MKKILFAIFTMISITAMAQEMPPQGPPPQMDSAKMHEMMVKRYKSSDLGLTDTQIDSVVAVNQSIMGQMHNQKKAEKKERKKEMEAMEKAKLERLTLALGDEKLAKKVIEYDKENRRPGPGGSNEMMPPPPDNDQN